MYERQTKRSILLAAVAVLVLGSNADAANCTVGALCDCGDVVPAGAHVTLDETSPITIGACETDPAITVEGGATLDMGGQNIHGSISKDCVHLTGKGARLENGTIENCTYGVQLSGEGKHKVTRVAVSDSGTGFAIFTSGNKITECAAYQATGDGFRVYWGDQNSFARNHSNENGGAGYYVIGDKTKVSENTAVQNSVGFYDGSSTDKSNYQKNIASRNFYGYELHGSGTVFKSNVAVANDSVGIVLDEASSGGKLLKNFVTGPIYGIWVYGDEHQLIANQVSANYERGIVIGATVNGCLLKSNVLLSNEANNLNVHAGATGCVIAKNVFLQATADIQEQNPACGGNSYADNVFGTTNQPACVQ